MEPSYKQMYEDLIWVINETIAREEYLIKDNPDENLLMKLMSESEVRCLKMVLDVHRSGKGVTY